MFVSKSDIIARIRLIMDEIGLNESDFEDNADEKDLDTMVEGFALDALRFVNLNAPHELLEADAVISSVSYLPYKVEVNSLIPETSIGVFPEVSNFLRLICARCSAWTRPVYEPIKEGSPAWDKLSNKFLTGTVEDPRVSVGKAHYNMTTTTYENTELRLYCLPSVSPSATAEIYYMEHPSWKALNEDEEPIHLHLSYLLQDAFYYYLAYLVLMALGDNRSQVALQQALPLMGMETKSV